ncbi:MAG: hypothetical protein KDD55_13095 [Bdellovibrionales bacterium]|nr:hypothetical protein [Bdellovibrionales bacterium]
MKQLKQERGTVAVEQSLLIISALIITTLIQASLVGTWSYGFDDNGNRSRSFQDGFIPLTFRNAALGFPSGGTTGDRPDGDGERNDNLQSNG